MKVITILTIVTMTTSHIQGQNAQKLDLSKSDKTYYQATVSAQLIDVQPYYYLMISGVSAPEDPLFDQAIEAIYKVAYGIKFFYKSQNRDFVVPKMEAQWWVEGTIPFEETPRTDWHWNVLIPMPDFVTEKAAQLIRKEQYEKNALSSILEINFGKIDEGKSVQVLHLGSYDQEGPSIGKIFQYINESGLAVSGHHHEIYLNDPRKTAQEKLRTIIRYPVK